MSNSTARFSANRLAKEIHEANENVVRVYANGGSEFELKKAINLISETWMTLLQLNSHQEEYVSPYSSISFADKLKLRKAFSSCVDLMDSLPVAKWQEIDSIQVDGSVIDSIQVDGSPGSSEPSSYFGSTEGVGTTRRSRAAYVVTAVVTSALIYHHTKDWVDYGSFGNFESVVYRNSVDFNCRKGMKLMQCKVYDGKATDKYMQKLFTNLEELVKKANEGRGSGKSRFSADIPVLFELSTKREIDEKLSIVGFDPDDFGVEYSDDDADSDIDAAETCNC
jgi:hypothetical protein